MGTGVERTAAARSPWPHRLAVLTAGMTVLLILVGGLVTNTGSALAVPDWPTTFGYNMFLYPWSQMVGGVLYEHSHRLIGSTVGMLTVVCAVLLWRTEPRQWVRMLGLTAVVGVILQGVLGGLRVVLLEHGLAIIHGCVAQAFLALMTGLAVVTSHSWDEAPPAKCLDDAARLRSLALVTAPLIYLQLVFGALLTHTGSRLDAHVLGAGLVTLVVCLFAGRVVRLHADRPELHRPAVLLFVLLWLQLSFGLGAYLWHFTSVGQTMAFRLALALLAAHRVTGAAIWATAVVLTLRILRLTGATETVTADNRVAPRLGAAPSGQVLA